LDAPETIRVRLSTASSSREIRLGAAATDELRFAHREGRSPVLAIPAEGLDAVVADEKALGPETLTPWNRYRVVGFDYRVDDGALRAERGGERDWVADDGRPLDAGEVYALLVRLLEARVAGWSAVGAASPTGPAASLDVTLDDGERERLEFFADGRARVGSMPHLLFRLASPPPPIPESLRR